MLVAKNLSEAAIGQVVEVTPLEQAVIMGVLFSSPPIPGKHFVVTDREGEYAVIRRLDVSDQLRAEEETRTAGPHKLFYYFVQ